MKSFEKKVAVVTGGASGIGRALADRFAAEGMRVVIGDVEESALATAERDLRAAGAEVLALRVDVSQPKDVEHLADRAWEAFGGVHVLCNNAGVSAGGLSWEIGADEWEWVLGVNLWGVIHGVRIFVPRMLASGEEGHVVNTASVAGLVASPGMNPYNVSKFGVVALSETLHLELATIAAKVKVSVLCPGWVNTRIVEAERNRPDTVGVDRAPNPTYESLRDLARSLVAAGLPPARVAEQVLAAIRDERFYVLTHPDFIPIIRERMDGVLAGRNPTFSGFAR